MKVYVCRPYFHHDYNEEIAVFARLEDAEKWAVKRAQGMGAWFGVEIEKHHVRGHNA